MSKIQIKPQSKWITSKKVFAVLPVFILLFFSNFSIAQSKEISVDSFDKVIVSPHIEVVFKEGNKESITIESITVPIEKLNIEVKKKTLNVYLDDAKITADNEVENVNGYKRKTPIYKSTVVRAVITYKSINNVELRGEERFDFESAFKVDKLRLRIFGESQVYFSEVNAKNLQVSIYGESFLMVSKGTIEKQKITAYGETKVNTQDVLSKETKLTAYGDGVFQLNVSEKLKVTSYGEATIVYSGSPTLNKGIVIGETKITKVGM
ncbi:hypothetical protein ULMS_17700 [Patiriisocius marinistellae]|uniref:Putative auto-transporter adhesin head GIN domain-containing protein n=1 Tax=Patiriisocius marinistellae TaxID=2494560 RepID=A0A5J4FYF3_9FLAO|nr:head GIN domain-containing protein [Patiriisocius marinistellae]GEQ86262.1 hypothetical protein ULMS_17700 [Patiriisocius marinistellae]